MSYHHNDDFGFALFIGAFVLFWFLLVGGLFISDAQETKSENVRYKQCLDLGKDWDEGECTTPRK